MNPEIQSFFSKIERPLYNPKVTHNNFQNRCLIARFQWFSNKETSTNNGFLTKSRSTLVYPLGNKN